MRRKGFTLIELLAVIIILAIIALIATPIILNVIEDARKSAGKSEASMILSGINNYCATSAMKNQLDGSADICNDTDGVTIDDVSQMVSLGNAEVLEVKYENGKVTKLKVKSNNYEIELQPDGSFSVNGEATDPVDPTPGDDEYVDNSGANAPKLYNNMIPIKYDGSNWVYADTKESWYNYDNQEWANAVVLSSGVSKKVGDTISESDIALWYVWIPRYTYQLFNANNGSVEKQVINVKFEDGTSSSGTVKCVDSVTGSGEVSETCTNASNGNWYTHPAFTFGDEELTGFWVGKFEISTTDAACNTTPNATNCNKVLPITMKPGVSSYRYANNYNFFESIKEIKEDYNLNGDSHMIKNMEWGAVAYLKQSKYGLGDVDIAINNNGTTYYTGGGVGNAYKDNVAQSTTGNMYGVYDMSGNSLEIVMGNMVNSSGGFNRGLSGFTTAPEEKYYDKYIYGISNTTHSRGRLGDAMKETLTTFGSAFGGWYSDFAYFVYSSNPCVTRGGAYVSGSNAGVFSFHYTIGSASGSVSSRAVLS